MSTIGWTAIKDAIHAWVMAGSGLSADRVRWGAQNAPRGDNSAPWIAMRIKSIDAIGSDWQDFDPNPLVIASTPVTAVTGSTLTAVAHGRQSGDGPIRFTTSVTLPAPLALATNYWVIRLTANTFQVAASLAAAVAGTAITLTNAGTGTLAYASTAATVAAAAPLLGKTRGHRAISVQITCFPPAEATDASEAQAILADVLAEAGVYGDAFATARIGVTSLGPITAVDGVINSVVFEPRAILPFSFLTTSELVRAVDWIETADTVAFEEES